MHPSVARFGSMPRDTHATSPRARDLIERIQEAIASQDKAWLIGMMFDELHVVARVEPIDATRAEAMPAIGAAPAEAIASFDAASAAIGVPIEAQPAEVLSAAAALNSTVVIARAMNRVQSVLTPAIDPLRTERFALLTGALTAKTGSFEITTRRVAANDVADTWLDWVAAGGTAEVFCLEGRRGVALLEGCRIVMAIGLTVRAGRLACCNVLGVQSLRVLNEVCDPLRILRPVFHRCAQAMCVADSAPAVR